MSTRGRLITIEGIDGAGKTTLAAGLLEALRERGLDVELLREPGGVELSERLRELVKDPRLRVDRRAEALIYAAARAQLVAEGVVPRLERGTWVLLDRFVDSSLAYQGAGRKLGLEEIAELNHFATGGLVPDRTLLLVLTPEDARARTRERSTVLDRLEQENEAFFGRVLEGYEQIARQDPTRVRRVRADRAAPEVLRAALGELDGLIA
ncbi:MAG TPA: dTMP kinase [Solirubrobacteraceae bacterium]|jgi:dTMP kinase|nr:dTMP kinase [Solirubrobacteraceae bacterium]